MSNSNSISNYTNENNENNKDYVWKLWLPSGLNSPDRFPKDILFRNHKFQCTTDSLATAVMFANGTGHFLQYIAMFRSTPFPFIDETIESMFETDSIMEYIKYDIRYNTNLNIDNNANNVNYNINDIMNDIKKYFKKFMNILIKRIRNTLTDAGKAYNNTEYITIKRQRAPSINATLGKELKECLNEKSIVNFKDKYKLLPNLINGFIHMIGINVTGDLTLQPLLNTSSSYINTANLPSYMLLSSIMFDRKELGTDTIRPVKLSGRIFKTRKNRIDNNSNSSNSSNNSNSSNSSNNGNSNKNSTVNKKKRNEEALIIQRGHVISMFESNEDEWLYRASVRREINFKKNNWTKMLKVDFPHIIYPYYITREGNMFVCRIHFKYTNKGNKITKLTVYNPETGDERKLNEDENNLLINGKKTLFVSMYQGIGDFLKESNFLKAVYGNTSDNIVLRVDFNYKEIQIYTSVNWDIVEEWGEKVFHPFVKKMWPIYRKDSKFPDIYDPWKEIA